MKKIVGIIQPFDIYQTFYVYEDGNKLEIIETKIDEIPDAVLELSQAYHVYQVDIFGPTRLVEGFSKKIKEQESLKYNQNKLVIKCV